MLYSPLSKVITEYITYTSVIIADLILSCGGGLVFPPRCENQGCLHHRYALPLDRGLAGAGAQSPRMGG